MRDAGSTNGVDNNSDSKNACTKANFSTYNITNANIDMDAGDTTGIEDAGGTSGANNDINSKNTYGKIGFGWNCRCKYKCG